MSERCERTDEEVPSILSVVPTQCALYLQHSDKDGLSGGERSALVRKGRPEEGGNDVHHRHRHVIRHRLQREEGVKEIQ